jgi:MFS family permease
MTPAHNDSPPTPHHGLARRGLIAIFGSTFLELVGVFMLSPLLLILLKGNGLSTALAGLFAACGWVGVFLMTPLVSGITRKLGRRQALWLAAAMPLLATTGFLLTDNLGVWFALEFMAGMAGGLRWVLAEAVVAELSPPELRGRYVGLFETMVGATFVVGPALLAWVGPQRTEALTLVLTLMAGGLLWSLLIPPLPRARDADVTPSGARGIWQALTAHPVVMVAGFVGGFFESGVSSLLPLYGLALGLGPSGAALLVSASGLGSALMMLPAGLLADRMAYHPSQRWGTQAQARQTLMRGCAWLTLAATAVVPWVASHPALAWPVVFLWGGAGGCLYTLAMIDIGSRETGLTLVNGTAVLVMAYTLGGVLAPALGALALDVSATVGFPALMLLMAAAGVLAMHQRLQKL